MRNLIFHFTFLLILASCTTVYKGDQYSPENKQHFAVAGRTEDIGFSSERLARIDSFFSHEVNQSIMPNAVILVARHARIVYFKSFGWKNVEKREAVSRDDIFRIASQSKAIVTVALMQLYEQGKFLLDDPVSAYIPEFRNPQVLVSLDEKTGKYTTRPATREITIRNLLSHTSGIAYGNALFARDTIPIYNSLRAETIGQVVKKIARQPLLFDPGTRFSYGMNLEVAGYLVELFSGMKLDAYLQKNIFEPLGMTDSYFYLPESKASRLVTLYEKVSPDSLLRVSPNISNQTFPVAGAKTYFTGGAGLVGTIEDYAKFCQMLINGGSFNGHQILGRKTIDLMTTNQIGDSEVWGNDDKFGLGFQVMTEKTARKLPYSIGSFKWGGMYATDYLIDPREDLIFLIYSNVQPFYAYNETMEKYRILVYQALTGK